MKFEYALGIAVIAMVVAIILGRVVSEMEAANVDRQRDTQWQADMDKEAIIFWSHQ